MKIDIKEITKIRLDEGEKLYVEYPRTLSMSERKSLIECLEKLFKGAYFIGCHKLKFKGIKQ